MSRKPLLVGTSAYNAHVQNMVRALWESELLYEYVTSGADNFRGRFLRGIRSLVPHVAPALDRQLASRAISGIPPAMVDSRWGWELARVSTSRLRATRAEDWVWQRAELALDRRCAHLLRRSDVGGFLGVEYGALASLRAARALGKPGIVAFLSPHHATRTRWVDAEIARFPQLQDRATAAIDALTPARDGRRDEEARTADWIVTNSSFTTRSMIDAGFAPEKVLTVPLGGAEPIAPAQLPTDLRGPMRCVYVGPVSVRKGAHYLLRAWRHVARPGLELHFYGKRLLPEATLLEAQGAPGGGSIVFHGSVPSADLPAVYREASVLVLPTLCDGFGMVVSEALANGLPVITTWNAGAADVIDPGKSGFVIPPADEGALVEALTWCADHRSELLGMRRAALAAAARWTWADFRQLFRQELSGALEGRRRPAAPAREAPSVAS